MKEQLIFDGWGEFLRSVHDMLLRSDLEIEGSPNKLTLYLRMREYQREGVEGVSVDYRNADMAKLAEAAHRATGETVTLYSSRPKESSPESAAPEQGLAG